MNSNKKPTEIEMIQAMHSSMQTNILISSTLVLIALAIFSSIDSVIFKFVIPLAFFVILVFSAKTPRLMSKPSSVSKLSAIAGAQIGLIVAILILNVLHYRSIENYSGGGADIGLGLVMLAMPLWLILGMIVFGFIGSIIGPRIWKHQ